MSKVSKWFGLNFIIVHSLLKFSAWQSMNRQTVNVQCAPIGVLTSLYVNISAVCYGNSFLSCDLFNPTIIVFFIIMMFYIVSQFQFQPLCGFLILCCAKFDYYSTPCRIVFCVDRPKITLCSRTLLWHSMSMMFFYKAEIISVHV